MSDSIVSVPVNTSSRETVSAPRVEVISESVPTGKPSPDMSAAGEVPEGSAQESSTEAIPERMGKRFAELTKRQRELFQKEQELKEREEKLSPVSQALAEAKKNPIAYLSAAGLTFEEITEYVLNEGYAEVDAPPSVEKKLEALELKLSEKERKEQEAAEAQAQAQVEKQISDFKSSIMAAAESSSDFELVQSLGQHELVYDVILEHHAEYGEVLPIEDALKLTESYLEKQFVEKIKSTKKFGQPITTAVHQASSPSRREPQSTRSPFTLSAQNPSPSKPVTSEKLTAEQLKERAAAMLRFK